MPETITTLAPYYSLEVITPEGRSQTLRFVNLPSVMKDLSAYVRRLKAVGYKELWKSYGERCLAHQSYIQQLTEVL